MSAGEMILGTPCDDVIRVPGNVETVRGGAGDDTVFGGRGNDRLNGAGGNDRLFGGPGDDTLRGGANDDRLSGGFGFDSLDGEDGDDYVRGDATLEELIADSGGSGDGDTLSYATGVAPGFFNGNGNPLVEEYPDFSAEYPGFPPGRNERGLYIRLDEDTVDGKVVADNGVAPDGGGVERIDGTDFEIVIGTAFSDFIVGSDDGETIYGGGGGDVILGGDGPDSLRGGAEGDHLDGDGGADALAGDTGDDYCAEAGTSCERSSGDEGVVLRNPSQISVGIMAPGHLDGPHLYLTGSAGPDDITATYSTEGSVIFVLAAGSFDASSAEAGCTASGTQAVCPTATPPDSLVLAGMAGDDILEALDFPSTASTYVLGGEGGDDLVGSDLTEDVVVDGPGGDDSRGRGGDDVVLNNEGIDTVRGEAGNDLFLSNSLCDGDTLEGGNARDNASWSKLEEPVAARLGIDGAGQPDDDGEPSCPGALDSLLGIEDLEGTDQGDFFYGGSEDAQLLGRNGADTYDGEAGMDRILANDGEVDEAIDCGGDPKDVALVDFSPPIGPGDPAPLGCDEVFERAADDFRLPVRPPPDEPPDPGSTSTDSGSTAPPPLPLRNRPLDPEPGPPRTLLLNQPPRMLLAGARPRRVVFRFGADEPNVRFRCKLDRRPFRPCRSPRAYRVAPGRHAFRVFAIDAAGNRDRSPVLVRFRVRRR